MKLTFLLLVPFVAVSLARESPGTADDVTQELEAAPDGVEIIHHGSLRGDQDDRHLSGGCENIVHIDFATTGNGAKLKHGDYVNKDNWLDAYGLIVEATSTNGGHTPGGMARIFDTTKTETEDPDLGSPNRDCTPSGPGVGSGGIPGVDGENCNPQGEGNVLIIQESNKHAPDDNKAGGKIIFSFVAPLDKPISIGLMDVETKRDGDTYFEIYKEGHPLPFRQDFVGLGDNSIQAETIDTKGVTRVVIVVANSFGVRFLDWCKPAAPKPTTPPTAPPTIPTNATNAEEGTPAELATFFDADHYFDFSGTIERRGWVAGPDYYSFVCGAQIKLEPKQGGGRNEDDTAANGLRLMFCDVNNWDSQRKRLVEEGSYGSWRDMVMCPRDNYVVSMEIRYERPAARRDETAMNGLKLVCGGEPFFLPSATVTVSNGHWGDWLEPVVIPPLGKFVVAARVLYQIGQGGGDDVALVTIEYLMSSRRMCVTPYGYIDCFYEHPSKGCNDDICEAVVCGLDENCCRWSKKNYDTVCARLARSVCVIC